MWKIKNRIRDALNTVSVAEMAAEDPLPKLRKVMLEHQFTEEELDSIVDGINAEIDAAVEHALAAPLPDVSEIYKDVLEEVN